jgi:hypothetical protein
VENAFVTIYIRKNPVETAKNLLNLAIDSNIGDLAALEFIVGALVSKGDISTSMVCSLMFLNNILHELALSFLPKMFDAFLGFDTTNPENDDYFSLSKSTPAICI